MMPDGEAALAELVARQVHSVALGADAERRLAGERTADADASRGQAPRCARRSRAVIISFSRTITSSLTTSMMVSRAMRPRTALRNRHGDAVTLVDDRLRHAVHRAALVAA